MRRCHHPQRWQGPTSCMQRSFCTFAEERDADAANCAGMLWITDASRGHNIPVVDVSLMSAPMTHADCKHLLVTDGLDTAAYVMVAILMHLWLVLDPPCKGTPLATADISSRCTNMRCQAPFLDESPPTVFLGSLMPT
jgi:hypothetical protein